ncbi:MAG: NADH-quinone oxidoreductase subunit K [Negativicutes bacterium]|nr:NADH-quinone oxidoreductase subunit K [Negativicutes bacterium]
MTIETVMLIVGFLMILTGCYCLIRSYHMLKIIIGIEIAMKAGTMFLICAGYMNGHMGLAQAYVITAIVLEVVVAVVLAGVTIGLYHKYGNMDIRNLTQLKG